MLALPVKVWRTGDRGLAPLDSVPEATAPPFPARIWVDTDAACGRSPRTDPDDCFALALLRERPELRGHVARVVAVMGRRPGHIFHPAEGTGRGMLLGHGPVFRDLNFALDPDAARQVLAAGVPITLVPYDAARRIELTAADLDRLEASIPRVVQRSRGWLEYWRTEIGREGFVPFDLLAALYALEPSSLRCTPVRAWVGPDHKLFWSPQALLVEPRKEGAVLYCGSAHPQAKQILLQRFAGS